jgi:hypothetical protein
MIAFYNNWGQQRAVPADFMLVRYEDLQADTATQLRRALDFVGLAASDDTVEQAVRASRFEELRRIELAGEFKTSRLRPGIAGDPASFKARRGQVGGYIDYFDAAQRARLDAFVREQMDPYFGYARDPVTSR